jgi:hypothetical protein
MQPAASGSVACPLYVTDRVHPIRWPTHRHACAAPKLRARDVRCGDGHTSHLANLNTLQRSCAGPCTSDRHTAQPHYPCTYLWLTEP